MNCPQIPSKYHAFSLLEAIVALAILAGAMAVLSEVWSIGIRQAQLARDLTHAQLLCESKTAELVAGIEPLEAQTAMPLGTISDSSQSDWLCSIEINPTSYEGLMEVRVTVYKDQAVQAQPVRFSLVRWMVDPNASAGEEESLQEQSQSSASRVQNK